MKKEELYSLASMDDSAITCCKIISKGSSYITFEVDEGLEIASEHYESFSSKKIIQQILSEEQIENKLSNIVACSFKKQRLADIGGSDVLFKCILECYGQHRPLVLSPDMIWLVINQTLVKQINSDAEKYRDKLVRHDGLIDIIVESENDLLQGNPNWTQILDGFYDQIEKNTVEGIASTFVADFSTTGYNERIASIATLMNGVQSFFRFSVNSCICGIPYITLKGDSRDWEKVLEKIEILKEFDLSEWYDWLVPIIKEFIRTSLGKPNSLFWKNIARIYTPVYLSTRKGCVPEDVPVDGWCAALFPEREEVYADDGKASFVYHFDKTSALTNMDSEMKRVGFNYIRIYPDGTTKKFPMELWSGIVGVEEDPESFALTPVIGWFVRQSKEEQESLERLKCADKYYGIELRIIEVPEILRKLDRIANLTLDFVGEVKIPDWLVEMQVDRLTITGELDEEYETFLKSSFKNISINANEYNSEDDFSL